MLKTVQVVMKVWRWNTDEDSDTSMSNESMEMGQDEDSDTSMSNESDDEKKVLQLFMMLKQVKKLAEVEVGRSTLLISFSLTMATMQQFPIMERTLFQSLMYLLMKWLKQSQQAKVHTVLESLKTEKTAYVANMGEDTVSVLDLESMEEVNRNNCWQYSSYNWYYLRWTKRS